MQVPRPDAGFILHTGTGGHGYVDPRDASYRNMDVQAARDAALASIAAAPGGGMLDEDQPREIAELAAKADEHIVRVYSGRVETI
ncbi:hypothetical protein [Profundibacter sp.]